VPRGLTCSLPALWKGVLYDAQARRAAWELTAEAAGEERRAARAEVARRGLGAAYGRWRILDLARELAAIAGEGLRRIGHAGSRDPDERGYLEPVFEQLERGTSPGEELVALWEGEWDRSPARLLEYARY
jgi:glutamate--cysteine ligase